MKKIVGALCAVLICVTVSSPGAQVAPAPVHVTGVVTDAQTDVFVRRARVAVESAAPQRLLILTDERGSFSFDVPGDGTLTITKAGYARERVKVVRAPGAEPVALRVALKRGAAITGRVVDALGLPAVAATAIVRAVSQPQAGGVVFSTARTDDLGEFRFGGLAEGEFQVSVLPGVNDGRPQRDIENEAFNAATPSAPPIRVRPGDSVDIGQLVIAASAVRIESGPGRATGSSSVTGLVKDGRGRPMRVVVRLLRNGTVPLTTTSDAQGRFRFDTVPAGAYLAQAQRPGAPAVQFGQRYAGQPGTPIDVGDDATVSNIDFTMTGGTAITGTIWDEYGEPAEGASVRALQIRRAGDRLAAFSVGGVQTRPSDDRGAYRIFGLLPGRYLVVADVDAPGALLDANVKNGYVPVYYAGATNARDALPVVLDQGDAAGIDLAFRREPATRVTGTALDSAGRPVAGGVLLEVSQRSGAIMVEPKSARVSPDGTFVFESVPPGDYVVQTITPVGGVPPRPEPGKPMPRLDMEFGMQYVTVADGEPPPVLLRTTPGAVLHGRVSVDGNAAALPQSLSVWPFPTDFDSSFVIGSGPAGLTKKDDGEFDVRGVTGPRRFTLLSGADGWYLKEARVRGVDAMDTPFDFGLKAAEFNDIEVVVSPRAATISGTATRPGGEAVTGYAVLLFSTDSDRWYRQSQSLRMERPAQKGDFRIGGLPPGSYYLVALSDASDLITNENWQDPATLEGLRRLAMRVTVSEGETRSVTLRLP